MHAVLVMESVQVEAEVASLGQRFVQVEEMASEMGGPDGRD